MADERPHLERRTSRAALVKDVVQTIAITFAGLWALWTFVYKEQLLPERIEAVVTLRTELRVLGTVDGGTLVAVHQQARNTGRRSAWLLGVGTVVSVAPVRFTVAPDAGAPPGTWLQRRGWSLGPEEVLLSQGRIPDVDHLETLGPEEVLDEELVVAVPATGAAALHATATIIFDNRPGQGPLPPNTVQRRSRPDGTDELRAAAQSCDRTGRCRVATVVSEAWLAR